MSTTTRVVLISALVSVALMVVGSRTALGRKYLFGAA
jgi:hypothetical protein